MKGAATCAATPTSEGKSKAQSRAHKAHETGMPNVGEKSFPDKLMELHAASMDALVRSSEPAPPYQPYPGDHPCSVCGSILAFTAVGWPRSPQWFCKKHLEEFLCQTAPHQPTQSRFSTPSVGLAANSGEPDISARTSNAQLTLFPDGPPNTGS